MTRVTTSESMTIQAKSQLSNPTALIVAGGILILLGLVPGMPSMIFLSLGLTAGMTGYFLSKRPDSESQFSPSDLADAEAPANPLQEELNWDDVDQVDLVGLDNCGKTNKNYIFYKSFRRFKSLINMNDPKHIKPSSQ